MTFPKIQAYFIHGSTGCTCCSNLNFARGFHFKAAEVQDIIATHIRQRTVASQFARNGLYRPYQVELELLPDGRVILGDSVLPSLSMDLSGEGADAMPFMFTRISPADLVDLPEPPMKGTTDAS